MNSNEHAVLVTKHLKKTYEQGAKKLDVIKDVSLSIGKGEIVALVGQSGAGKSTLLHCLGLLDQPTSGEIIIKDVDVSNRSDKERTLIRRKIMGFVYQFHYLQPEFTALENVSIPLMIAGSAKKQAEDHAKDLLVSMGLEDRMSHRPARLSGGEQQRVSIARALANSPKILLADEPTGNLDEDTSARIFDLLMKAVKERGVSALIATHNQRLAAQMDRVLTLENGYLGV
jgi:lipoprotein-releasing system ATP-binding protein